ncbi:MAG: beta-galactosidase, partial [Lachnospiraceae bacterium]|nr:beta-galactosidase [Lachnospiraceae bacterium]
MPAYHNPVASYVRYFTVPENMKGRRLFISFQGAESGLALWLNGTFIGYSEDSFTPSEFELTGQITDGENKLAVQVFKWTSSSWCEDQDFYRFSGIYRDVYLYTIPELHVQDLLIRAVPDASLRTASLDIRLQMQSDADGLSGKALFRLALNGKNILEDEKDLAREVSYHREIEAPILWSAEAPVLYDLTIEIRRADGQLVEIIPEKIGFRRFELKDRIMTLNGKRIVFKGVNRHEFSSVNGRRVSEEELRKDLETMKQNNINAIRTCHYPDDSLIYRLCDEYGLYLIDENNLESHGSWDTVFETGDTSNVVPGDIGSIAQSHIHISETTRHL